MANRDIKLGIGIETTGEQGLKDLAADVRGIGTAAEGAAPDVATLTRALEAAAATTRQRREAEAAARADAAAARAELNSQTDALARLRAGSDAATRASVEYADSERALRQAVVEARISLRDRNAAASTAATEAKAAAAAERALGEQIAATNRAAAASTTTVSQSVATLKDQLSTLRNIATAALGGTVVGALAKDLAQTADAYRNLGARIKLVTGDGQAFTEAFKGVQEVAERTGASLETTGTLFARITQAGKEFGLAQRDALALTETIAQATQLSGASAESANAAITQLLQGLGSGVLRGDEFNSVMEQAPRLAQALAAALNITTGELRKLAEQGGLTSQTVIQALQGQADTLRREFDTMPATVERAMGRLNTAWQVYVGQANQGAGATATAATAIEALARNLSTVAELLYGAGKAGAAFAAAKGAAAFLESATAARAAAAATAAATAATTAHTAATVANTAAQGANAAASATAAAGAGRFAAAIANVKLGVLVGVLTNLREIGTALGEGVAKLAGWGKASAELEAAQQREAEATRRNAAEKAALAQRTQQAADAALGLNKESRELVATFDGTLDKTHDVTEALQKLTKELRISDVSGITAAGAALDALAQRGKIAGYQVREALSAALKDADLLQFETTARAAFDSTVQGARRLQAALDAVADEALRRAGTSTQELATGFSKAATSAVNDVDTLAAALRNLTAPAEESGRALSASLDKALSAANTSRAVEGVIGRIQSLGREGLLTGDQLAAAMEKARKKTEELTPGVNSVAEALRTLGLKSAEESKRIADNFAQAWARLRDEGTVSIQQKIEAFARYRAAAIEANGGVESSEVALQRRILEAQADVRGLGDEFEKAMGRAAASTRKATEAIVEQRNATAGSLSGSRTSDTTATTTQASGQGNPVDNSYVFQLRDKFDRGQLTKDDLPGVLNALRVAKENAVLATNSPVASLSGIADANNWVTQLQRMADALQGQGLLGGTGSTTGGQALGSGGRATPSAAASSGGTSHTVNINIGGKSTTVNTASDADASALAAVLRELDDAAARA